MLQTFLTLKCLEGDVVVVADEHTHTLACDHTEISLKLMLLKVEKKSHLK